MESEAVPETPLDILQEFARSNSQALQQLAARAEPEMLEHAGFAPIFPDTCYHLTHYWLAAVDIPVASDNP
ncbi:hypothetical protein ABMI54_004904, partial [Escherichia coli]